MDGWAEHAAPNSPLSYLGYQSPNHQHAGGCDTLHLSKALLRVVENEFELGAQALGAQALSRPELLSQGMQRL